jgi:cell division cycle protein 37
MIQRNPKSIQMFTADLEQTYTRIATRTVEMAAESAGEGPDGEREQIQLVAEDPNIEISFNLPDGPPPKTIRIEGEGAEQMDMEEVKAFLQRKWEIFEEFPEKLRTALRSEKLTEVNKVLGNMKVAQAEEIVGLMQEGGMLSFSEKGVRDMTNQE